MALGAEAVKSLARIETINAQTAQTIESTGGAAGVTAKHVENLAGRLESLTASEAEATQEGANMLLTFTNIQNGVGKGNKIFDQTTKTLVDMSRALGSDPQQQAIQLGKALNDPIKGVSALSRVGVAFTDQQKKTIEGFVKTGDTMKAQKVILGELNKEFGGSGEAYAKTAAGQAELAKHAFGTLTETVFAKVLPVLGKLATLATDALNKLNDYGPQIQSVMSKAGEAIKTAGSKIAEVFDYLRDNKETVAIIASAIGGAVAAFVLLGTAVKVYTGFQIALNIALSANPIAIIVLAVGALIGALVLLYKRNETVRNTLNNLFSYLKKTAGPVVKELAALFKAAFARIKQVVQTSIKVVTALWKQFGPTIIKFVKASFNNIKTIISGVMNTIKGVIKVVTGVIKGDWSKVWSGIKDIVKGVFGVLKGIVSQGLNVLKTLGKAALDGLKAIFKAAWDGIVSAVKTAISNLLLAVRGIPGAIRLALMNLGSLLLDAGKAIIQGLIDGITSMIGKVKDTLGGITKLIPKVKGPASVDKVLLTPAGRMIMQSLIDGFEDGKAGVKKSLSQATDLIKDHYSDVLDKEKAALIKRLKAQKKSNAEINKAVKNLTKKNRAEQKAAVKSLGNETKALIKNADKRTKVYQKLAAARKRLADLEKAYADYSNSVKGGIDSYTNITALDSAFNSDALAASLKARLEKVKQFTALIQDLVKRQLDPKLIDQLVSAGVEGGLATAQAIASGGADAITNLNGLQQQVNTASAALAKTGADNMYAAGIKSAEALIKGLEKKESALERLARRMGLRMALAVQEALGQDTKTGGKGGKGKNNRVANKELAINTNSSKANTGNRTYNINVTAPVNVDKRATAREIRKMIEDLERTEKGLSARR